MASFCNSEFKNSMVMDLAINGTPFYSLNEVNKKDPMINYNISWNLSSGKRMILLLHLYISL